MVYCNYIKNTENSVTYAYGGLTKDITGELVFHFKTDVIEIVKTPDMEDAPSRHIKRLYGAQKNNFSKGVFKDKISYES